MTEKIAGSLPFVSVVIPCRNEVKFIQTCLESVVANDYPHERLEILMVDGMSDDGTRLILEDFARRYPMIRIVDNPKRITPVALNTGIAAASGDIIVRMDAHARLARDYISRSVQALATYKADNVGGIMHTVPQRDELIGWAIVSSLSHRFGVGNSYFRVHSAEPRWVDTVFGGCYPRGVFARVGLFNEKLARGQDVEFNLRLKKIGGRTLLVPSIVSFYYARSDFRSFCRHNWGNGLWAILPFLHSPIMPVSWRHLVPLAFVVAGLVLAAAAGFFAGAAWALAAALGAYTILSLLASADVAVRRRDPRYLLVMPVVFASLHFAYGLGSLWGVIVAAAHRWSAPPSGGDVGAPPPAASTGAMPGRPSTEE